METGKIVQLLDREFGFIKRIGIKDHLFFHADDLTGLKFRDLHEGDRVQFSITESLKGPYATHITKAA
ncbi:MAG: cold-shock protein [Bacillota bacterium]